MIWRGINMPGRVLLRNRTFMIKAILGMSVLTIISTIVFLVFFITGGMSAFSSDSHYSSPGMIYNVFAFAFSLAALLFCFDSIRYSLAIRYGTILPVAFAVSLAAIVFKICYDTSVFFDAPELQLNSGIHLGVDTLAIVSFFILLLYYCGLVSHIPAIIFAAIVNLSAVTNAVLAATNGELGLKDNGSFCLAYGIYSIAVTLSVIYIKPVFKPVSDFDR